MRSRITVRGGVIVLLALLASCGEGSSKVTTEAPSQPPSKKVSSIAVSATQSAMAKGTAVALNAKAIYDDNSVADVTGEAAWASSDASVVGIFENRSGSQYDCQAKGLKIGNADISASFGGRTGTATLSVSPAILVEKDALAISARELSLHKGNTAALVVIGLFTDGTHQELTSQMAWSSKDESIATVVRGQLKANAVGSTTITASFAGQSVDVAVQVAAARLVAIAIDDGPLRLIADLTKRLTVSGSFEDGTFENVNGLVSWSVDNPLVARVAADGTVTAKAAGSANVTAAAGGLTRSVKVTVAAATLIAVEIEAEHAPLVDLPKGMQAQLKAIAKFDNGSRQDVTEQAAWTSSDRALAVVSAGRVTALKLATGAVVFNATFGGFGGVFRLHVSDAVVMRIDVSPPQSTLPAGLKKQLSARGAFSDDRSSDVTGSVTWSTSDPGICSVSNKDAMGLLSTSKQGLCTVTAKIGNVSGTASINVTNAALTKVTITPLQGDLEGLPIGLSKQFVAMGTYTDGNPQDITNQVFWSSSNDAAAGISNKTDARGLAFAIEQGETLIKAEDPETHLSNTVVLNILPAAILKIDVSCEKQSIPKGLGTRCSAMATYSLPGVVLDLSNSLSWNSGNPDAASVGLDGVVLARDLGKTKITAKDPESRIESNAVEITVTDAVLVKIVVEQNLLFERLRHRNLREAPPGYPVEFKAKGYFSDKPCLPVDITNDASWSIVPGSICQMSSNFAVGTKPGRDCVVAAAKDGIRGTATLVILDAVLNSMEVTPTPARLAKGTTGDFHAWGLYNVRDWSAGDIASFLPYSFEMTDLVSWSTHDIEGTSVAEISNASRSEGRVTALDVGRATVQAIDPKTNISGQADLHVSPAMVASIALAPSSATIRLGQWQQFGVIATLTDGTTQDVTRSASCWMSDNERAATLMSGHSCLFFGAQVGAATIHARFAGHEATAQLTVLDKLLLAIKVQVCERSIDGESVKCRDAESIAVTVGQNAVFRTLGYYTDTDTGNDGIWDDMTPFIVWDSSDRDVVHVSNDLGYMGSATGLAVGNATITAIDPETLVSDGIAISVVPAVP
jgi:hypothetical protein